MTLGGKRHRGFGEQSQQGTAPPSYVITIYDMRMRFKS